MLERVGQQLVDDQTAGHSRVNVQKHVAGLYLEADALRPRVIHAEHVACQFE